MIICFLLGHMAFEGFLRNVETGLAPEGFQLPPLWGYAIGAVVTLTSIAVFVLTVVLKEKNKQTPQQP